MWGVLHLSEILPARQTAELVTGTNSNPSDPSHVGNIWKDSASNALTLSWYFRVYLFYLEIKLKGSFASNI